MNDRVIDVFKEREKNETYGEFVSQTCFYL